MGRCLQGQCVEEVKEVLMNVENEADIVTQEVRRISEDEAQKATKRMKNSKAFSPNVMDRRPVEAWKYIA